MCIGSNRQRFRIEIEINKGCLNKEDIERKSSVYKGSSHPWLRFQADAMSDSDLLAATNMAEISYRHHCVSFEDDLIVPFATARKQEQEILISDLVNQREVSVTKLNRKLAIQQIRRNREIVQYTLCTIVQCSRILLACTWVTRR